MRKVDKLKIELYYEILKQFDGKNLPTTDDVMLMDKLIHDPVIKNLFEDVITKNPESGDKFTDIPEKKTSKNIINDLECVLYGAQKRKQERLKFISNEG